VEDFIVSLLLASAGEISPRIQRKDNAAAV
jgi:hypothetical protein